ncbi:hypothetical protein F7P73_05200 [Acinetobacter bohemicus]|jgi:hypothetical protein|uniref:SMODS and SLOG-associating 2TM effector domain-containing protein n=1 Tax=Acinetobacter bohemicus TaxID=1435036 RepID=A0A1I6QJ17_9GAMM|nr:hypothetical protein [Acinetobacter bohemicus]KAB0653907.1 hypothetical protein F7P73_05200 [Acinetobacter bohemicus]SFS52355.1 hypothetical protein SAMN05444586_100476 [Acinetobacter bohemicus]
MTIDREKYKILYEYQKTQYDDEKLRYSRLDDKATKYLTSLAFLTTVYTFIVSNYFKDLDKFLGCLKYLSILSIGITFILFFIAWGYLFKVLKSEKSARLPTDNSIVESFHNHSLESNLVHISELHSQLIDMYREISIIKNLKLSKGYDWIKRSYISMGFSLFLIFISLAWNSL